VLRTWRDNGLFDRYGIHFLATNGNGRVARKVWLALVAWLKAAWWLSLGRVKVIHVHTSSYASFWRKSPLFLIAWMLRRPFIVSLHGGAFRNFFSSGGPIRRAWIKWVMRSASRFIVLTPSWREWVLSIEPRARLAIIPNTTNVPATISANLLEPDLLLYLGRVEAEKGVGTLLAALSLARSNGARWRLVIGGTGSAMAEVQKQALDLGLTDAEISFPGWLDEAEKQHLLQRCAMLVLPSLIENMPVCVIEAFAYGKPVIATRVGGLTDMVEPGRDGWLVAPSDPEKLAQALNEAFTQRAELPAMGQHAREKALCQYSPDSIGALLSSLYEEVMLTT